MARPAPNYERIAFVASSSPEASEAREALIRRYGNVDPDTADVVVALGGDGLMLQTLHRFMKAGKPIYGMHRGTVGFLMNEFSEDKLQERLTAAQNAVIHPLLMCARDVNGQQHESYAINEVSLYRQSYQAARLRILIDGKERLPELVADGVLVSTRHLPCAGCAWHGRANGVLWSAVHEHRRRPRSHSVSVAEGGRPRGHCANRSVQRHAVDAVHCRSAECGHGVADR